MVYNMMTKSFSNKEEKTQWQIKEYFTQFNVLALTQWARVLQT